MSPDQICRRGAMKSLTFSFSIVLLALLNHHGNAQIGHSAPTETSLWTLGLVNSAGMYLTGERFQDRVVATGVSLKTKQIWTLVRVDATAIALKNSFGKYLTANSQGNLDCSGASVSNGQKFRFETQNDGSVAIKCVTLNRYVGSSGDSLSCYNLIVDATNLYKIHLAIHPQINLRNVNRNTYVHLRDGDEYLDCKEEIPWGYDAMLILEYHSGRYAIRAANSKYLRNNGDLVDELDDSSMYTLVFRDAQVAFKDYNGYYLTAVGESAKITTSRTSSIGMDELFFIEDSHPQVRLIAIRNGRYMYVSIRRGVEVQANQADTTDTEIFQMEAVDRSDMSGHVKWAFRSNNKKYWQTESGNTPLTSEAVDFGSAQAQFTIEWMGPLIALKAQNGKYFTVLSNGRISANSNEPTDACKFVLEFINRPIIVLRGNFGFVGTRGSSGTLECNRSQYDVFAMSGSAGTYQLRATSGKFWKVENDNSITATADTGTDFFIELRAHTRMLIVAPNGNNLIGAENGGFSATGSTVNRNTLWEY